MAIIKNIEIDGKLVPFKASAAIPRIYRLRFGRDIFADVEKLTAATQENDPEKSDLDPNTLGIFEDVAYTMAKYADPSQPETPEEWLDQFNIFTIYFVLPQIIELWHLNTETTVESKKKVEQPPAQ